MNRPARADDTPAEAAFRSEVRSWLEAHARRRTGVDDWSVRTHFTGAAAEREHLERCRAWQRTLFEGGWAAITWPPEYGGRGGAAWQNLVFRQEVAAFDVTTGFLAATIALVGPALLAFGTDEQKARHLPPMLRGDVVWCQLFSEPGAGSDLANLATRAVRDGDHFVVNGQKVWNSSAHLADWGILLTRTDPDAPKHRGLTMFLVDMHTPGVDPRPLRTITGAAHFDEVFLTDVMVPAGDAVGEIGGGWPVARLVLANESTMIGSGANRPDRVTRLIDLARRQGRTGNPVVRQALADCWIRERVLAFMGDRLQDDVRRGRRPSLDGSVLKVFWSESRRDRGDLAVHLLGPAAAATPPDQEPDAGFWPTEMLNRFWGSIGGGTDEVHRTNMAERVLGLPPEPRVDRDAGWAELQRR